jgi:hypothetical protein
MLKLLLGVFLQLLSNRHESGPLEDLGIHDVGND